MSLRNMTSQPAGISQALQQNMKHNGGRPLAFFFLRVAIESIPYVPPDAQATIENLGHGFFRVTLHRGFMDEMNVPKALQCLDGIGARLGLMRRRTTG